jgi:preprotein translocase subunit YajC
MMPKGENSNPLAQILPLVLIIAVFYLFMIRPQMKKQKELKTYRASLSKGDKVITTGGIHGKVADIKEQIVLVEIADNIRIKVDKSAILKDSRDIGAKK